MSVILLLFLVGTVSFFANAADIGGRSVVVNWARQSSLRIPGGSGRCHSPLTFTSSNGFDALMLLETSSAGNYPWDGGTPSSLNVSFSPQGNSWDEAVEWTGAIVDQGPQVGYGAVALPIGDGVHSYVFGGMRIDNNDARKYMFSKLLMKVSVADHTTTLVDYALQGSPLVDLRAYACGFTVGTTAYIYGGITPTGRQKVNGMWRATEIAAAITLRKFHLDTEEFGGLIDYNSETSPPPASVGQSCDVFEHSSGHHILLVYGGVPYPSSGEQQKALIYSLNLTSYRWGEFTSVNSSIGSPQGPVLRRLGLSHFIVGMGCNIGFIDCNSEFYIGSIESPGQLVHLPDPDGMYRVDAIAYATTWVVGDRLHILSSNFAKRAQFWLLQPLERTLTATVELTPTVSQETTQTRSGAPTASDLVSGTSSIQQSSSASLPHSTTLSPSQEGTLSVSQTPLDTPSPTNTASTPWTDTATTAATATSSFSPTMSAILTDTVPSTATLTTTGSTSLTLTQLASQSLSLTSSAEATTTVSLTPKATRSRVRTATVTKTKTITRTRLITRTRQKTRTATFSRTRTRGTATLPPTPTRRITITRTVTVTLPPKTTPLPTLTIEPDSGFVQVLTPSFTELALSDVSLFPRPQLKLQISGNNFWDVSKRGALCEHAFVEAPRSPSWHRQIIRFDHVTINRDLTVLTAELFPFAGFKIQNATEWVSVVIPGICTTIGRAPKPIEANTETGFAVVRTLPRKSARVASTMTLLATSFSAPIVAAGGPGGLFPVQAATFLQQGSCAPLPLKQAGDSVSFLVAPYTYFHPDGHLPIAFRSAASNIGIAVGLATVHFFLTTVIFTFFMILDSVRGDGDADVGEMYNYAMELTHFPNISILAYYIFMPGTVFNASRALTMESEFQDLIRPLAAGILAFCGAFIFVVLWIYRRQVPTFCPYPEGESFWLPTVVAGPVPLRRKYGILYADCRTESTKYLGVIVFIHNYLIAAFAGASATSISACRTALIAPLLVIVAVGFYILKRKPFRTKALSYFQVAVSLGLACVCISQLSGLTDDPAAVGGAQSKDSNSVTTTLSLVSALVAIVTLMKVYETVILVWELQSNRATTTITRHLEWKRLQQEAVDTGEDFYRQELEELARDRQLTKEVKRDDEPGDNRQPSIIQIERNVVNPSLADRLMEDVDALPLETQEQLIDEYRRKRGISNPNVRQPFQPFSGSATQLSYIPPSFDEDARLPRPVAPATLAGRYNRLKPPRSYV